MRLLDRPEVAAWWLLAESDLRVARVVADLDPPEWHLVCFLAQQCGEKALKAVLEAHGLHIPRSHDLGELTRRLPASLGGATILDAAIVLSDYGVWPRYPVPEGHATAQDAREALAAAAAVRDWVRPLLDWADPTSEA